MDSIPDCHSGGHGFDPRRHRHSKDLSATFYLLREHEVRGSSPRLGTYAQLAQLVERVNAGLVLCSDGELVNTAD